MVSVGITDPGVLALFAAAAIYGAYVLDDRGWSGVDLNILSTTAAPWLASYGWDLTTVNHGPSEAYTQLCALYGALQLVTTNSHSS